MIRLIVALILLTIIVGAHAHDATHAHGVAGLPDWYDPDCCNLRDCHPVEDSTITFGLNAIGQPVVFYRTDTLTIEYERSRWRTSQDERYHACNNGTTGYCVYIRGGA